MSQEIIDTNSIIGKIARRHNLPFSEVEKAIRLQFEYVAYIMSSGNRDTEEFYDIRLPYFGIFKVHKVALKRLLKQHKEKQGDTDE